MRRPVLAGAGLPQVPDHLPRRHTERRQQTPGAIADVLELTLGRLAGQGRQGGVLPPEDLHPRLFIAAEHQSALLVEAWGVEVQLANVFGFGVEAGVMTVEPVNTLMGLEVGLRQDALDGATVHGPMVGLVYDGKGQFIQGPRSIRRLVVLRLAAGQREDVQLFVGGKSSGAYRGGGHLAVLVSLWRQNVRANGRSYGGCSPVRQRCSGSRGCRPRRRARQCDTEKRGLAEWSGRAPSLRGGRAIQEPVRRLQQRDLA